MKYDEIYEMNDKYWNEMENYISIFSYYKYENMYNEERNDIIIWYEEREANVRNIQWRKWES